MGWTLTKGGWTQRELPFTTVGNLLGQNSQQQPGEGEGEVQGPEDFIFADDTVLLALSIADPPALAGAVRP